MPAPVSKITKDTITVYGASQLTFGHGQDLSAIHQSSSQIYVWSGCDRKMKLFEKLANEWSLSPFTNTRYREDLSGLLDQTNRICIIYITKFFRDKRGETDFLFFVKGYANMGKFLRMTFSGRAYDDPCFATPMRYFDLKQLLQTPHLECTSYDLVSKNETKGIRWKYLYQSAVNAWNKLEYDKQKDSRINEKTMKPIPEKLLEPEDSSSSDNLSDDEDEELQASGTVQN